MKNKEILQTTQRLYKQLSSYWPTLYDDREERTGVKFKDADLIGIPLRVTIGNRYLKEKKVEIKMRKNGETLLIPLTELESNIERIVASLSHDTD
jgi:prolyl-tRNA synthetase